MARYSEINLRAMRIVAHDRYPDQTLVFFKGTEAFPGRVVDVAVAIMFTRKLFVGAIKELEEATEELDEGLSVVDEIRDVAHEFADNAVRVSLGEGFGTVHAHVLDIEGEMEDFPIYMSAKQAAIVRTKFIEHAAERGWK